MPSLLAEAGRVRDPYSENLTMSADKTPATDDGKIKDPADWVTGDEPMTGAQDSYLHTLARKAGEEVEDDLTKAEASIKIDELREKVGVDDSAPKQKGSKKAAK
jgi:hypothetical protein